MNGSHSRRHNYSQLLSQAAPVSDLGAQDSLKIPSIYPSYIEQDCQPHQAAALVSPWKQAKWQKALAIIQSEKKDWQLHSTPEIFHYFLYKYILYMKYIEKHNYFLHILK